MAQFPTWKKYTATVVAVIEMLLFSGVVYGWANMVLILKNEGYFNGLCESKNSTALEDSGDTVECPAQADRLTLIFTLAVFAFNFAGFLGGVIFDRFGTRILRLAACSLFFLVGIFSFFLSKENANLVFPIMLGLAFAGMFTAISIFQIAELHPNHRLAVSSSLSGALDSSSVVFLIFKVCYDAGVSFRWILLAYCIMAIAWLFSNSFIFMPKTSFALEFKADTVNGDMPLGETNPGLSASVDTLKNKDAEVVAAKDSTGNREDRRNDKYASGWRYILTSRFLWLLYYLSLLQLRLWFFVGSLNTFLIYRTNNDKDLIDEYSARFGLAQFFGFIFAPFTGIIMDMKSKLSNNPYFGPVLSFTLANLLCLTLGVLVLVPVLEAQYVSFVVQVAMRAFLYASVVSFIIKAFPIAHFGKLYGASMVGAAMFVLLQYPVFILLEGPFDGNPFWVNLGFLALSLTGFCLPLSLVLNNGGESVEENTRF